MSPASSSISEFDIPIPGTTKIHRLEENIGSTEVKLSSEELREIEEASYNLEIKGARYTENIQKLIDD